MTPVEILKNTAQELRGDSVLGAVAAEIVKEVGESILQAELERVEGEIPHTYRAGSFEHHQGLILTDHANYIKSQIKLIEEL